MTDTVVSTNHYVEAFEARSREAEPQQVRELRERAMDRFVELGFPTVRMEEWRHLNVAPIARTPFARALPRSVASSELAPLLFDGTSTAVFVDGRFDAEASRLEGLPSGVVVDSLARVLESGGPGSDQVAEHLGRLARFDEHAFAALNTALFDDGGLVYLPSGTRLEEPLHLLFVASAGEAEPQEVSYPRNLIVADATSEGTVIESYVGLRTGGYLSCGVTEVVAAESSNLRHYKVQKEGVEAFHVALQQVALSRSANFRSLSLSLGGGLVRNDIHGALAAEGVDCTLDGLYLASGRQQVDNHMRVEHLKPHGSSHELYKGILDGRARAVFNGRIYVHPGAQKTDAKQTNRNLLLSPEALVQSNPQLEIFADDVRCTHGSTTGQLDAEALFYMRTRGLDADAARGLLTYAFASELIDGIEFEPLREDLEEHLVARLPGGDVVRHVR